MSYCRWSSDNWKCDLYCYEHVDGTWTTHVARNRIVGEVPEEADILEVPAEEWAASHAKAMAYLNSAEHRDIELPYAGKTFKDPTLEAFKERLLMLRAIGYHFPDYVLAEVDEEIKRQ